MKSPPSVLPVTVLAAPLCALADDRRADAVPDGRLRLRRLTVALVRKADAHAVARVAAILLAGQKGYAEVRPDLRRLVSGPVHDVDNLPRKNRGKPA